MLSGQVGRIDFPTLGDIADEWTTQHCRVPDGFTRGKPFRKADWQFWCTANRYRVREDARFVPPEEVGPDNPPVLNQAFTYRQTVVVGPQKTGKGPNSAADTAFEAAGPSVFAGWARSGDVYRCDVDGRCPCGWYYEYEPGEPKGLRHPSPLIQLTATSEDQVDNIYRPLRAMIKLGPLKHLLAVREGFVKVLGTSGAAWFEDIDELDLDDLDRIDRVTAKARSKLGNPISDAEQDEIGLFTKSNGLIELAETQRRGAAGMGGRTHGTTNAWDPAALSYAQEIYEANRDDVWIFYRNPDLEPSLWDDHGRPLSFRPRTNRRKILAWVYDGSWWVDIDSVNAEAEALMEKDPAQAERFFGNRLVRGDGVWLPPNLWEGAWAGALAA